MSRPSTNRRTREGGKHRSSLSWSGPSANRAGFYETPPSQSRQLYLDSSFFVMVPAVEDRARHLIVHSHMNPC
jgi:hypothetical protein